MLLYACLWLVGGDERHEGFELRIPWLFVEELKTIEMSS
jgi:hypothetical protein